MPPPLVVQASRGMTWTVEPTWIVCQSCAGLVLIQALGLPEWREQWGFLGPPQEGKALEGEGPGPSPSFNHSIPLGSDLHIRVPYMSF